MKFSQQMLLMQIKFYQLAHADHWITIKEMNLNARLELESIRDKISWPYDFQSDELAYLIST